jgi:hypothetical protein
MMTRLRNLPRFVESIRETNLTGRLPLKSDIQCTNLTAHSFAETPTFQNSDMLVQCILTLTISWASWKILRHLLVKTDLDNVRGPDSPSFLTGAYQLAFCYLVGCLNLVTQEIFRKHSISMRGNSIKSSGRSVHRSLLRCL